MNLWYFSLCLVLLLKVKLSSETVFIGANIDHVVDWSRTHAFVDLIKQSRAFGSPSAPWITNATTPSLDANGWPTADFGVILWTDTLTNMTGTYKMSFECDSNATISFVASRGTISNIVYNPVYKNATADLIIPDGQTSSMIAFTNTRTGVRNLKIIRPGYDPLNPPVFTTPFINHFKQFNTIRFMDWAATNGNPSVTWSQRTLLTTPSMTGNTGVAWEYMIKLCNQLNTNMWLNVPHQANDDYVTRLATLVYSTLNANLNVYVEYSNEMWNGGFPQYQWALQQAIAEVNANASSILNYDNSNNQKMWVWRFTARRAKQVIGIFKSVFGATAYTRVKGVFAAQIAYADGMLHTGLKFIDDNYGNPNQYFAHIAGAPYFNLGSVDANTNLTMDGVISALNTSSNAYQTDYNMLRYAFLGVYYGLPVVAYEGGPDTFGGNNVQAKRLASEDARAGDICKRLLDIWYSYGFNLFNWFVAGATSYDSAYGTWGLAEVMSNLSTPKALAIKNYIATKTGTVPPVTIGIAVPGSIDARQSISSNYYTWKTAAYPTAWTTAFIDYLVTSSTARTYNLVLSVSAYSAQIQIIVNNKQAAIVSVTNTNNVYVAQTSAVINLNAGLNAIRLYCASGFFGINSLTFS